MSEQAESAKQSDYLLEEQIANSTTPSYTTASSSSFTATPSSFATRNSSLQRTPSNLYRSPSLLHQSSYTTLNLTQNNQPYPSPPPPLIDAPINNSHHSHSTHQLFGTFPNHQAYDLSTQPRTLGYGSQSAYYQLPYAPLSPRPTRLVPTEVVLTDGEFILDIPLSDEYTSKVKYTEGNEFTNIRYSAVTSKPDDFPKVFSLRQKEMSRTRKTKIAVVCTMYNEDEQLFTKTMSAVMDNIAYLCSLKGRKGWGEHSWRDIVVCIVSDGVKPCNPRTLDVLAAMGCYMDGLTRSQVNGKQVEAHMFEFTTQVRIDTSLEPEFTSHESNKVVPMQTIFLLKEKNAKKINSHRWFFNGVCEVLKPEVCILIDVGTKPTKQSFYHLNRAFERNSNVAGACGEIAVELGRGWKNLANPLVAVQNFEYKMSNILDKPLESVFGYISVLPGAFSAYRYAALQEKPLESYFKGEALHAGHDFGKPNVSQSNMYLAEDRILCFELVMKRDKRYILKYVKSAKAETDVPTELPDLLKQRRRWFNGSFFASVFAVQNVFRIFTSGHTFLRKIVLLVETLYNAINLVYSWFSIASIYICFYFMFNIASTTEMAACNNAVVDNPSSDPFYPYGAAVSNALRGIYIASFITMVVASLGNNPSKVKPLLILIAVVFALCMALMLALVFFTVYSNVKTIPNDVSGLKGFMEYVPTNANFSDLLLSLFCTYVLYIISSMMFLDPWHPFTCLLQYLLMTPAFSNMFMVYAFCNIHDISWGTKGQDSVSTAPAIQSRQNDAGRQVATTNVPAPDYANELNKLRDMAIEIRDPHAVTELQIQHKTSDDHFKAYRTYVLMWWFLSNFALVYILTDDFIIRIMSKPGRANPFLVFLLWSVAGLTGVRFLGCFVYWVQWIVESVVDSF
ncbi:Chitin synthase, class 1 [Rhizoclosmatium sp. JEL0117]|nr:Chitin synthase, class 1 [Rhizoclosmatium sp. JEL0117]